MIRSKNKAIIKRKEERKDFPDFYKKHVDIIKSEKRCCMECGVRLIGDVSEVAHILNKSQYKSISTNDNNVLYLCGWKQNNCHDKFDSGKEKEMKVYSHAREKLSFILGDIKEKLNYKILDKWEM